MKNVRMVSVRNVFVVMACAALLAAGSGVSAKPAAHGITAQQRAASDQAMREGLTDLQAASSVLPSGNAVQASLDLQNAVSAMQRALPIYNGPREWATARTQAALREIRTLQGSGGSAKRKPNYQHVEMLVSRAIQNVQSAVGHK